MLGAAGVFVRALRGAARVLFVPALLSLRTARCLFVPRTDFTQTFVRHVLYFCVALEPCGVLARSRQRAAAVLLIRVCLLFRCEFVCVWCPAQPVRAALLRGPRPPLPPAMSDARAKAAEASQHDPTQGGPLEGAVPPSLINIKE